MAFFQRAVTLSLFALAVSAAPASGSKSELTIEDIINAPYNPPPLADPAFAPIVAASNETFVEGNPAAQSKVDNVASVLASITAAASTATLSVETPAPTTITNKPKLRRAGGPTSPPPTPDYVSQTISIRLTFSSSTNHELGSYRVCKLLPSLCTRHQPSSSYTCSHAKSLEHTGSKSMP